LRVVKAGHARDLLVEHHAVVAPGLAGQVVLRILPTLCILFAL
jgi:hypothetical protein